MPCYRACLCNSFKPWRSLISVANTAMLIRVMVVVAMVMVVIRETMRRAGCDAIHTVTTQAVRSCVTTTRIITIAANNNHTRTLARVQKLGGICRRHRYYRRPRIYPQTWRRNRVPHEVDHRAGARICLTTSTTRTTLNTCLRMLHHAPNHCHETEQSAGLHVYEHRHLNSVRWRWPATSTRTGAARWSTRWWWT